MAAKICPSCQFENKPEHRFCTQCGTRLMEETPNGPKLIMLYSEGDDGIFKLNGNYTTVGRDVNNDIVIKDGKISKRHAAIFEEEGDYWIKDLESKNGVFVNGQHIGQEKRLFDGNLIKLGFTILRFENA